MPASAQDAVSISIIVPCWRDDALPTDTAARWLHHPAVREILVAAVDEAAAPDASGIEPQPGLRVIRCPRAGRGCQMNHAARFAGGDVLLFQHVDTELLDAHLDSLRRALAEPAVNGGAFRRQFDERHPHLRWLEPWEALRSRLFGPMFGDQSIFVRRAVFEQLGGYSDVPLMEDVDFTCRLRRHSGLALLTPSIRTSARKHLQQGRWRTTLQNALLLALYTFGVSPRRLHGWYYRPG